MIRNLDRPGPWQALTALLAIGVYFLMVDAPNDMTGGDPGGSLLSAQALISQGSLDLSAWPDVADPRNYRFDAGQKGVHYALGFGSTLLAVPAVYVAGLAGWDMADPEDDRRLQRWLAAGIVAALFVVATCLFNLVLPLPWANIIALFFTLGTSLASTLGTAYWNLGPSTLLITCAIYFVAAHDRRGRALRPLLLGGLLGAAFLVRPTALLALGAVAAYTGWRSRRGLPRLALGLAPWLLVWVFVNRWELGMWLPDYYRALGQQVEWDPRVVLEGQLLSPGRGVLVFTPFIAPIMIWIILRGHRLPAALLGLGGAMWFIIHAASIARFWHWWGGSSYGPRLATDSLPAVMLMALAVASDWRNWRNLARRRLVAVAFAVLALVSVWIHTVQGLYRPAAQEWNRYPDVEAHWSGIFNWRWPQFLASDRRNAERDLSLRAEDLEALPSGIVEPIDGHRLLFSRWNALEVGGNQRSWRWTRGVHSYLAFRLDPEQPTPRALILELGVYGKRSATVLWNDVEVGSFSLEGQHPRDIELPLPASLIGRSPLDDGLQLLEIRVPEPLPADQSRRELGVILYGVRWDA